MNRIKRWLTRLGRPAVWAHRGASAQAPENSLAALLRAAELGADGVEFDVQACATGELIVFHDATLGRCTGLTGAVRDTSANTLRGLRLDRIAELKGLSPRGERIPFLDEWLAAVPPSLFVNLEVKCEILADAVTAPRCLEALQRAGLSERSVVSSFHPAALWQAAAARSVIPRGVLVEDSSAWKALTALGLAARPSALHPEHTLVTPERVRAWHRLGLVVATWTVDEPDEAKRCYDAGVDVIISNRPDIIRRVAEGYLGSSS
jgi:glycerophosphoryl diester phosphodiesterase